MSYFIVQHNVKHKRLSFTAQVCNSHAHAGEIPLSVPYIPLYATVLRVLIIAVIQIATSCITPGAYECRGRVNVMHS